jgi:hypothetical protein
MRRARSTEELKKIRQTLCDEREWWWRERGMYGSMFGLAIDWSKGLFINKAKKECT